MTDVCERRVVHCPEHEASHYLAGFVAEHQAVDGTVRLVVRLPVSIFVRGRAPIERRVVARLSLQSMSDRYPTFTIIWSPWGNSPSFEAAGVLAVEKQSRDDRFTLILSGQYEAFGMVDPMFDATRDHRIAQICAHDLLRSVAHSVENARAHTEAALAGHSRFLSRGRGPSSDLTHLATARSS